MRMVWWVAAAMTVLPSLPALAAETACRDLAPAVPSSAIALPSGGATITSVYVVTASNAATGVGPGASTGPTPEHCRIIGSIAPIDPEAPPINFQVNLPAVWNHKALQFGGGGFNGTLVTGLGPAADAAPGTPMPLAQGYATFGTDSGHQVTALSEIQAFALNDEALVNFAYASYKKVRDVAIEIIRRRYGLVPARIYYMGTSEGGREGLAMAQRFPRDYDGVISRVPVINWTGLQHAGNRSGVAQQDGGWLNAAKVVLVGKAVLSACDALDGLADGIVSNYTACGGAFKPEAIRCSSGNDEGDGCLSDRQIAAIRALHAPFEFPFAVANGIRAYPGYGYGGEAQAGGFPAWVTGARAAAKPRTAETGQGQQWMFGNGAVRYFILRDAAADPYTYAPAAHADRVKAISELMDATNPDLSAFAAHGGKMIVKEHMADYAQSPFAGINYYRDVVAKMGQRAVDRFMRLYVTPGVNHGGVGVSGTSGRPIPQYVDLLGELDRCETNRPPADLVQTSVAAEPPHAVTASRPLCAYPTYPRYRGSGDPNAAASFDCSTGEARRP